MENMSEKVLTDGCKNQKASIKSIIIANKRLTAMSIVLVLAAITITFQLTAARRMEYRAYLFIMQDFVTQASHVASYYQYAATMLEEIIRTQEEPSLEEHRYILHIFGQAVRKHDGLKWGLQMFFQHFDFAYYNYAIEEHLRRERWDFPFYYPHIWINFGNSGTNFAHMLSDTVLSIQDYEVLLEVIDRKLALYERNGVIRILPYVYSPGEGAMIGVVLLENRRAVWDVIDNFGRFVIDFYDNQREYTLPLRKLMDARL